MSEEEKKLLAEEAAKAAAQAATTTPPATDPKVDALKKELEQAQYTIVKLKEQAKTIPQIDVEAIKAEAAKAAADAIEKAKTDLARDTFDEELAKIAKTDDEKQAILNQYNNGIIKTGIARTNIASDLARAALLANAPKLQAQVDEIKKAAISTGNAHVASPTGTPVTLSSDIKLSAQEEKWINDTSRATGKSVDEIKQLLLKNKSKNY